MKKIIFILISGISFLPAFLSAMDRPLKKKLFNAEEIQTSPAVELATNYMQNFLNTNRNLPNAEDYAIRHTQIYLRDRARETNMANPENYAQNIMLQVVANRAIKAGNPDPLNYARQHVHAL